jgi:hypothetical protein
MMDQHICDKLFNLKNLENKVFLFSKLIAQKLDMVKHDHMQTAQSLVDSVKFSLTPFHNMLATDTALSTSALGQHINNAFIAADAMANNNIGTDHMHDLKVSLDGIWQIANPVPMPNPMMPCMPVPPINPPMGMNIDISMLQNMVSQFANKDCAHTDFNMLASDLQMLMNNPMCNNNYNPMNPMYPTMNNPWSMDNFELYEKCLNASELASVLNTLNAPMMPPM